MRFSIIFFAITSLIITFSNKGYNNFPGIQLNIIAVLLIMNSLVILYTLDAKDKTPIYQRPIFWITTSTLIFYCSLFALNGTYNYLLKNNESLAKKLNLLINNNLNFMYYLLLIIGLLCSKQNKKYSSLSFQLPYYFFFFHQ